LQNGPARRLHNAAHFMAELLLTSLIALRTLRSAVLVLAVVAPLIQLALRATLIFAVLIVSRLIPFADSNLEQ
jgi:hypothetical protein